MKKWLLTMGVLLGIAGGPAVAETWPLRINIWNVCPASYPSYQVHDNYFINIKQTDPSPCRQTANPTR